jgi:hypothetical protein
MVLPKEVLMAKPTRLLLAIVAPVVLAALSAAPVAAQVEDNLSVYSAKNAAGYLQPLADAVGADLDSGIFRSAYISESGFHLSVEIPAMLAKFGDDDRTFGAATEEGFYPEQTVNAPTVAGRSDAVIVDGEGGTSFAFPGGLDLNSFALAAPQLRVGSFRGTDVIFRYIALDVSDEDEFGSASLFGFGIQHSISQYLQNDLPLELAAGFFWHKYSLGTNKAGDDLMSGSAFTIGVQGSRRFGTPGLFVEPYGGLSLDTHSMEVAYESQVTGESENVTLDMDSGTDLHLTVGVLVRLYYIGGYVDYGFSGMRTFSFGITLGN